MQFLCGILILAGVFALNDASMPEAQLRLINEQMNLDKLRAAAEDRALNDPKCFSDYLAEVTELLEEYQAKLKDCGEAKATAIAAINSTLDESLASISKSMEDSCGSMQACAALTPSIAGIQCYNTEATKSASLAKSTAALAATYGINYDKDIANVEGVEKVCTEDCNRNYSDKSMEAEDKFARCKNEDVQPPAEETTTTTTTTTTELPPPPPPVEGGEAEAQGEQVARRARAHSANKYRRF